MFAMQFNVVITDKKMIPAKNATEAHARDFV
jgi:hypothetical protein